MIELINKIPFKDMIINKIVLLANAFKTNPFYNFTFVMGFYALGCEQHVLYIQNKNTKE